MPIYEYLCQDCAHKFELKQSMKDEAVAPCTKCGKSVGRIISAPAIMFKGSGWYITDYSDKMKPPTGETTGTTPPTKKDTTESAPPAPVTTAPAAATPSSSSTTSGSGTGSSSTPSSTPSASGNSSGTT